MDGLDLLKKHWQKDNDFPKVNKEEIRQMLYKSSSSLVKWIFMISLIELFIGLILNVVYFYFYKGEFVDHTDPFWLQVFDGIFDIVSYLITFYFIYSFFMAYRRIQNTNKTKDLLNDILNSRKQVSKYISFNIYLIICSLVLGVVRVMFEPGMMDKSVGEIIILAVLLAIFMTLIGWLIIKVMKFYFRILYIRLVKKLENNYDELLLLEDPEESELKP